MLKEGLLADIEKLLQNEGYAYCAYRGCFDLAAKREKLLFLKILQNIDSFSEEQASNLTTLSRSIGASAFLIGKNTTREKLEQGVVYERFGIPAVCFETFRLFVSEGIFPEIYRQRGGLFVHVDKEAMRETRKRRGMTQMELAELVGVSKKAIYEHEARNLKMLLSIAQRLEEILQKKLVKGVEPEITGKALRSKPSDELEKKVGADLRKLGFNISFVKQAPADIFARKEALLISDVEGKERKLKERAEKLGQFIGVAEKPAVIITERAKEKDYDIPVVRRKELAEMSSKSLFRLAKKSRKYK
ncbi:MAG: hypothetical protein QXU82_02085 [Candidatus Aenigmatarchaeota archaeon]